MLELRGTYGSAKVFTDQIEAETAKQIVNLLNQEFVADSRIRIMPDCHAGAGCVIGFTADLGDMVIPNIVGVDIGCGMLTIELGELLRPDFAQLDQIIRQHIPSGMTTHAGRAVYFGQLQDMHCYRSLRDTKRIERSIGTLGGGNHFIEVAVDSEGKHYLVIHSGSRNFGKQVAEHYQALAIDLCSGKEDYFILRDELIATFKREGRRDQIQGELKKLEAKYSGGQPKYPEDLCFLTGSYRQQYLQDMQVCQAYAALNRATMAEIILKHWLGTRPSEYASFETIHNYISFDDNIIRKGAVSARAGERLLIPLNMRDGSLICVGKGAPDWNFSAPHGAGRLMSRTQAKQRLNMAEYRASMAGIYTTSVDESTLDEAAMAYKPMEQIVNHIGETVEIVTQIKPVYNFKACE